MNEYVTDEEQVERIKAWWKDNGGSVVAGLVIGIGGFFGWIYWQDYQAKVSAQASAHFDDMITQFEQQQYDSAISEAQMLFDDYGSSSYAEMARLTLARIHVEQQNYDQAASQLKTLMTQTQDSGIEMVARRRLATVLYQQGEYDEALSQLEIEYPEPYTAAFEELKGDILVAKGNTEQAREAYQKARLAQPSAPNPQFLQQKLEDLGQASSNG
jgi:predicted negative regulator of RcsB-dependent stress response